MTEDRMYKVREVAERLGLHPQTIRSWLRDGALSGFRPGGTKAGWRVSQHELEAFIERRRAPRQEAPE